MKIFSICILITALSGIFFIRGGSQNNGRKSQKADKGVYVISQESFLDGKKIFKFPDDSVFVSGDFAMEQVMRLDQYDFNGKVSLMQSVDMYHLIDFNKGLFKDIGRDLQQQTQEIPWKDLKGKKYGTDFRADLHFNENFKMKDTLWEGKDLKNISYTADNREQYDILLEQYASKERFPVFCDVVEQRFKGRVLKMTTKYPDGKGEVIYTVKFIPLDKHPVLEALTSLK